MIKALPLSIPLYLRLPGDVNLTPKHVGGSQFMYNLQLHYVHMLVCINDYKQNAHYE